MKAVLEEIREKNLKIDKSKWTRVKFGQVAVQKKDSIDRDNTDVKFYVKGDHMESEDLHIRQWGELADEYLGPAFIRRFESGDILYGSRRTYLKKVAVAHFDGITSNTTFVINANEKLIIKELLPFVMLSEGFTQHSIKNSKGSVNPYINWKDIANYEFFLPPKDQQARLAELLWAADQMVETYDQTRQSTANLKLAIQRKYFEKVEAEDLIEISKIGKVFSGGTPDRKIKEYWNGDIPWAKTAEVNYCTINETEEYITQTGLDNSAAKLVKVNSVILAMYGEGVTRGRVAIAGIPLATNQACAVIETTSNFSSRFLYYYLEFRYEELRSLAHGANQQNLNLAMIKDFNVPALQIEVQEEIVSDLCRLDSLMSSCVSAISHAKQLQKSLINQIF